MVTKLGTSDEAGMNESIDPETLAAFLDGTLPAEARAEVLRKLAANRDDFDTLIEARALLDAVDGHESVPGGRPAVHMDARIKTRRRRWLAVPAALAVAATAALLLRQANSDPLERLQAAALLRAPTTTVLADSTWVEPGWVTTRGAAAESANDVLAFRLGARAAAVEVAAGTNDVEDYRAALTRAGGEARSARLSGPVVAAMLEMAETGMIAPEHQRDALWSELRMLASSDAHFDLGVCVESARIAHLDTNARFFANESPMHEACRKAAMNVRREGSERWVALSDRATDLYNVRPSGPDSMGEVGLTLRALMSELPR